MTTEKWREEFDEKFNYEDTDNEMEICCLFMGETSNEIKLFISTLLSKERNEAMKLNYWDKEKRNEVLDEVEKEVEERRDTESEILSASRNTDKFAYASKETLDWVSTIIENLKVK